MEWRSLSFFPLLRVSDTSSSKYSVCDGVCAHTPCRTHIVFAHFLCVTCSHRVHAWLKVFAVCMSYLSISPSPFSRFIRRLCCSGTVTSTPRSRPHRLRRSLPDPKARVKRTSLRAPGSLATWPIRRSPQDVPTHCAHCTCIVRRCSVHTPRRLPGNWKLPASEKQLPEQEKNVTCRNHFCNRSPVLVWIFDKKNYHCSVKVEDRQ